MTSLTMNREMTSVPLEVKATGETGESGTFEGYGAIFGNLDRDGDVVARGAFAESLKGRMPALLWQHNAKEPIGRFDVVREDQKGLFVKGRLSMEGRGREAYDLLKMGALDGLSIGFVTKEASRDAATGTRTITRAELMEISLVTFPANELARVASVKSTKGQGVADTPRDFERMLRAHGISRTRAKAITAKGFGGAEARVDHLAIAGMVDSLKVRQAMLEAKGTVRRPVTLGPGATKPVHFNAAFGKQYVVQVAGMQSTPSVTKVALKVLYYGPRGGRTVQVISDYKPHTRFRIGPPTRASIPGLDGGTVKVIVTNTHPQNGGDFSIWLTEV